MDTASGLPLSPLATDPLLWDRLTARRHCLWDLPTARTRPRMNHRTARPWPLRRTAARLYLLTDPTDQVVCHLMDHLMVRLMDRDRPMDWDRLTDRVLPTDTEATRNTEAVDGHRFQNVVPTNSLGQDRVS